MTGGSVWSSLFFLLLSLASLTSIISVSEVVVAFLCDEFHIGRKKAATIVTAVTCVTATLCSLSFGPLKALNLFNLFDYISANILMTLGGLGICVFAGWRMKNEYFEQQMRLNSGVSGWLYRYVSICIRYICPVGIFIVFIAGLLPK